MYTILRPCQGSCQKSAPLPWNKCILFWGHARDHAKKVLHYHEINVYYFEAMPGIMPNKSPKGHWSLTWVQWALLLKVRFLSKSESMTVKFVKSVRTANNHDISIQDTRMHSVCCCCIPIWRRSPLEKGPLIDPFLRRLGSTSGRICPKSL